MSEIINNTIHKKLNFSGGGVRWSAVSVDIIRLITANGSAWTYRKEKHALIAYTLQNAQLCLAQNKKIPVADLNLLDLKQRMRFNGGRRWVT